jgi:hypothetical protein
MSTSAEHTPEFITPNQMGDLFFSTNYKMQLGIWIVQREVGNPFDVETASEAFSDVASLNNSLSIARRIMPTFVDAGLIECVKPASEAQRRHEWAKLENPWWQMFEVANKIANQV